jgi:hypothetical protein
MAKGKIMLTMNEDLEGALKEYLKLLDEEEYFEAHEVMEEAWHPLRLKKHPLANLTKGFINAAIGFEHIKRERKNAHKKAKRVMESYERHIHLCKEDIKFFSLFDEAKLKIEALKEKHKEVFTS